MSGTNGTKLASPATLIFAGLAFGIALFGVSQLLPANTELAGAGAYGLLVGGLSLFIGSIWNYLRGETLFAAFASFFGLWATFLFVFVTSGLVAAEGLSLYAFAAIIPFVIFAVPAIRLKATALWLSLLSLIGVVLFVGLANLPIGGTSGFQRVAGVFSLIAAILLWYQAVVSLKE